MDALPPEVVCHIFSFMQPKDLCTCMRVSATWKILAQSDSLWDKFVQQYPASKSAHKSHLRKQEQLFWLVHKSTNESLPESHPPEYSLQFLKSLANSSEETSYTFRNYIALLLIIVQYPEWLQYVCSSVSELGRIVDTKFSLAISQMAGRLISVLCILPLLLVLIGTLTGRFSLQIEQDDPPYLALFMFCLATGCITGLSALECNLRIGAPTFSKHIVGNIILPLLITFEVGPLLRTNLWLFLKCYLAVWLIAHLGMIPLYLCGKYRVTFRGVYIFTPHDIADYWWFFRTKWKAPLLMAVFCLCLTSNNMFLSLLVLFLALALVVPPLFTDPFVISDQLVRGTKKYRRMRAIAAVWLAGMIVPVCVLTALLF